MEDAGAQSTWREEGNSAAEIMFPSHSFIYVCNGFFFSFILNKHTPSQVECESNGIVTNPSYHIIISYELETSSRCVPHFITATRYEHAHIHNEVAVGEVAEIDCST